MQSLMERTMPSCLAVSGSEVLGRGNVAEVCLYLRRSGDAQNMCLCRQKAKDLQAVARCFVVISLAL